MDETLFKNRKQYQEVLVKAPSRRCGVAPKAFSVLSSKINLLARLAPPQIVSSYSIGKSIRSSSFQSRSAGSWESESVAKSSSYQRENGSLATVRQIPAGQPLVQVPVDEVFANWRFYFNGLW